MKKWTMGMVVNQSGLVRVIEGEMSFVQEGIPLCL